MNSCTDKVGDFESVLITPYISRQRREAYRYSEQKVAMVIKANVRNSFEEVGVLVVQVKIMSRISVRFKGLGRFFSPFISECHSE